MGIAIVIYKCFYFIFATDYFLQETQKKVTNLQGGFDCMYVPQFTLVLLLSYNSV